MINCAGRKEINIIRVSSITSTNLHLTIDLKVLRVPDAHQVTVSARLISLPVGVGVTPSAAVARRRNVYLSANHVGHVCRLFYGVTIPCTPRRRVKLT